jgi:hypothetical protein
MRAQYTSSVMKNGIYSWIFEPEKRHGRWAPADVRMERWKAEAEAQGWTWLVQANAVSSQYRHRCGHEQIFDMSSMRIGTIKCRYCWLKKIKAEAIAQGWEWLDKFGPNKSNYLHHCGHRQIVSMSSMRVGNVACHGCGESWVTKPSNVYVHSITLQGESIIKVGRSQNVEQRIKGYGLPPEAIVQTVLVIPTQTGKEAIDIESCLIQEFKKHKARDISHIMSKSGETECIKPEHLADVLESARELAMVGADAYEWVEAIEWAKNGAKI